MEKLVVQVEVSKEAYELAQALVKLASVVKEQLADGWEPLSDIPAVIMTAIRELPAAINGVDQLDDEMKADPSAFAQAFLVSAGDMAKMFKA